MSVVGIDLGTTNTVVGCVRQGKVHVLADEHGNRLLPSVVSFHPHGEVLVGAAAKARRIIDPKNTVYSHKRLIGRSWNSPEIAQAKQRFPFELREGPGQGPLVHARGQDYTLPEISAFVLKRARQIAERGLGAPVERAVITVPAHFNELQRASTKVAGRVSGLEVLRILNEPTAAALAYGLGRSGSERVAVFDFGGGTFDCTLLDLNGNVFEVLATAGDSFLGGDDIDGLVADRIAESFLKQHRYDPRTDPQTFERLKTVGEELKVALSSAETHTVVLKELGFGAGGSSIHFTFTLTRRDLEAMITPLVERTFKVTQDALALARLTPTSFDKVILVGGSTRIPIVRKRVEAFFGAPPMDRVNPDEVVAVGAAIQAAALTESTRGRNIPPPPPIMGGGPTTQRGLQNDVEPPAGAAASRARPAPPLGPFSGVPVTRDGPPPLGGGAVSTGEPLRMVTRPGVAPKTRPMAMHGRVRDEAPTSPEGDDLQDPTPFEWFPSSRDPNSADTIKPAVSERSFGAVDERPSPVGEPEPLERAAGADAFGHVSDLSLITSSVDAEESIETQAFHRAPPEAPRTVVMPNRPPPAPPAPPAPRAPVGPTQQSPVWQPAPAPPPAEPQAPIFGAFASSPPPAPAPVLVDVTPRALVVETAGGYTDTIIPRNSKIPCERTRRFATARDMQTVVRVRVAQGEQTSFLQNTYLGEVELSGLRAAPRGEVVVAVTFEVDADGTLQVRARDVQTGLEARAMLQLVGVADESSIAMMIDRFAQQPGYPS